MKPRGTWRVAFVLMPIVGAGACDLNPQPFPPSRSGFGNAGDDASTVAAPTVDASSGAVFSAAEGGREDAAQTGSLPSDAASVDARTSDGFSSDAPSSDAPSSDAPSSDAPSSDAPSSDAPSSDAPASDTLGQATQPTDASDASLDGPD